MNTQYLKTCVCFVSDGSNPDDDELYLLTSTQTNGRRAKQLVTHSLFKHWSVEMQSVTPPSTTLHKCAGSE